MKKLALIATILSTSLCSNVYANPSIDDVQSELDIKALPVEEGGMCVFITNTSDTVIHDLDVQINYKDDSGNIIDLEEDGHDMLVKGNTVVSLLDSPDTYSDYEITTEIELDEYTSYENHVDELAVKSNQGDDCVILEITNNSDVTVEEIEYIVVFYNGDNIIDVSHATDIYDVEPGKKVIEKVSSLGITYDKFEVYINQAHTFGL